MTTAIPNAAQSRAVTILVREIPPAMRDHALLCRDGLNCFVCQLAAIYLLRRLGVR